MYNAPEVSTSKPLVKQKGKQDVYFDYLPNRERKCVLLSIQQHNGQNGTTKLLKQNEANYNQDKS